MRLPSGGIDVFYIDESTDPSVFAMSAVAIPFLRMVEGTWTVVWEDHLTNIREWRKRLSKTCRIPVTKELNGSKMLSGRGRYLLGKHQLTQHAAANAYRIAVSDLSWLPPGGLINVVATPASNLFGHSRLEAAFYAMLQRMRTACVKNDRLGMLFFDEGHGEYGKLYRKARVYLPTGSALGGWGSTGATRNIPLDNFVKDGNIKQSFRSQFIQLVDMISFSLLLKIRAEAGALMPWQASLGVEKLFDAIPALSLNRLASRRDPQGIVRL